jgi:uncharacterized paraquat-inducible protein A
MFPADPPQAQKSSTQQELRPDQKRCRRCKCIVILEQQRCPFCGNAPWLWHPNSRFFIVTVVIAVLLLFLLPLMTKHDRPMSTPVSESP